MIERRTKPAPLGADLLLQQRPPHETTFAVTTAVEAIVEKTTKNGRTYQAIEYVDANGELKSVAVWDKKLLTNLEKGHAVELTLERKGAFWNLTGLTRLDATVMKPDAFVQPDPIPASAPALRPPTLREALSPRDRGIISANALTNAVNIVTAFQDVLTPANQGAIMEQVVSFYRSFLELHDTLSHGPGETTH